MGTGVDADTVLFAILPAALVDTTIGPEEVAFTLLLIVDVFAFILSAIGPGESTGTLHFVVYPVASVLSAVSPIILSVAFDVVLDKLTVVS